MIQQLGTLKVGEKGRVVSVGEAGAGSSETPLLQRLMEMGFLAGAQVEVLHEAPVWKDPIAVRTRGTLVALRRAEANCILVEVPTEKSAQ